MNARLRTLALLGLLASVGAASVLADDAEKSANPFHAVGVDVNAKMVKVFGAGGFTGLNAYGSGVIVSPDGFILTVASPMLDSANLRVHLPDGRRLNAKLLVSEPELDLALLKIETGKDEKLELAYFDVAKAAKTVVEPGDWVLGFSNQFQIATRDEPMSMQRGMVAAVAKLHGRRGIFDATFKGEVYVIDAITNNPGAGGGALTTRKGELIGLIGKELRNTLTETWLNYAIPLTAKAEIRNGDKTTTVTAVEFVEQGIQGKYTPPARDPAAVVGPGGYVGWVLVPNLLERTPPYIEDVPQGTPAATAGFQSDDLIVYFDGEPVASIKVLKELMSKTRPGMTVKVEVRRGDKLQTIDVKLADQPRKQ